MNELTSLLNRKLEKVQALRIRLSSDRSIDTEHRRIILETANKIEEKTMRELERLKTFIGE